MTMNGEPGASNVALPEPLLAGRPARLRALLDNS